MSDTPKPDGTREVKGSYVAIEPIYKTKDTAGHEIDVTVQELDGKMGAFIGIYNEQDGGQYTTYDIEDAAAAARLVSALGKAFPEVAEAISVERLPSKYVVISAPGSILSSEIYGLATLRGTNASEDAPEYVKKATGTTGNMRLLCAELNRAGGAA